MGSKENTPPQNQPEASVRLPGSSHFLLSSIGTDDSLQNVWKMLDQGLSSSALSTSDSGQKGEQKKIINEPLQSSDHLYLNISVVLHLQKYKL